MRLSYHLSDASKSTTMVVKCPCKKKTKTTIFVKCNNENCSIGWWHAACGGFSKDISKEDIESLGSWSCPVCVIDKLQISGYCQSSTEDGILNNTDTTDIATLKNEITAELKNCLPDLISMATDKLMSKYTGNDKDASTPKQVKHTLIITPTNVPDNKFTKSSWADTVKENLPSKLDKVPVNKSVLTHNGVGYMTFPDEKSRDTAKHLLQDEFIVESGNKAVQTIFPKLKINGIDSRKYKKADTATLKDAILMKNPAVHDLVINQNKLFEILFIEEKDTNWGFAVAKVDPLIRQLIKNNGNKIFIDLSSCSVSDRLHLVQCYTCQEFGHKKDSPHCKSKDKSVCLYCAKNHQSKNCPNKKSKEDHCCSNCTKSSNAAIKSNAQGHTSTSKTCPIVQNEARVLINKTMGMNIANDAKNLLEQNVIVM